MSAVEKKAVLAKRVIGIGDMIVSNDLGEVLITYGLGSCLGITIYDPVAQVGGLLHIMLPLSKLQQEDAKAKPLRYVETGVPLLFKACYELGADKKRLIVRVAGGANMQMMGSGSTLQIGKRNIVALKRLLMKNRVITTASDVGGTKSRTMTLNIESGLVDIVSQGKRYELTGKTANKMGVR